MRNTPSPPPPGTFERIVWLNVRRNLLGSALGRRVLGHYIGAVLVPIAALLLLVYLHVPQTLRPTRDAELAQSARAYGVEDQLPDKGIASAVDVASTPADVCKLSINRWTKRARSEASG